MELTDIAWAAGFVDGEGYIGLTRCMYRKGGYYIYRPMFSVGQVMKSPLVAFQSMFGGRLNFVKNKHQGYWEWRVVGREAIDVIQVIMPFLRVKRKQAELMMEYRLTEPTDGRSRYREIPADVVSRRQALWAALSELNGGRALQAERASEKALVPQPDGAVLRSHAKRKHESDAEMTSPLVH